jgi:hypothetical protein
MGTSIRSLLSLCANKVLKLEWNEDNKELQAISAVTLPLTLK